MAPALAVPQYANDTTNKSSELNMESALDFDLLAEYLLEDVGAGGFDFSADVISPSIDATKTQQQQVSAVPQDPGVVTPNGSTAFVDPLADMAALQQPQGAALAPQAAHLPTNGDLAGELSQVQQMIATANQVAAPPAAVARPPVAPPQATAQPLQAQPQLRPLAQPAMNNTMMAAAAPARQPPVQQKPPVARAPVPTIQRPLVAAAMQKPQVPQQQPPPTKRQRVTAPPAPGAKGPGYSFAAANGRVMGTIPTKLPNAAGAIPTHAALAAGGGGRHKSQAQIDRRRERNRILARRTRLRKKFFFESLQKDVADLQRENAALKSIVRSRLKPDDARVILKQCNANQNLPNQTGEAALASAGASAAAAAAEAQGATKLDREDFSLIQSIQNSQQCFIITDPSLHDNPIVYASDDFLSLTGYSQEEVLGRNCRFLQGTETSQEKVAQVRKAVAVGEDVNVTFVNYTSDGKPFWNSLFIAALRDADNNIVNFIGVIVKVSGPEPGDSEYGKVLK